MKANRGHARLFLGALLLIAASSCGTMGGGPPPGSSPASGPPEDVTLSQLDLAQDQYNGKRVHLRTVFMGLMPGVPGIVPEGMRGLLPGPGKIGPNECQADLQAASTGMGLMVVAPTALLAPYADAPRGTILDLVGLVSAKEGNRQASLTVETITKPDCPVQSMSFGPPGGGPPPGAPPGPPPSP